MRKGGLAIFLTPFSWLEEFTQKDKWLSAHADPTDDDGSFNVMAEVDRIGRVIRVIRSIRGMRSVKNIRCIRGPFL